MTIELNDSELEILKILYYGLMCYLIFKIIIQINIY